MHSVNNILSFKSTPKEISEIKKACTTLATKGIHATQTIPVDTLELGTKTYLSTQPKNNKTMLKVIMKSDDGIESYTILSLKTEDETKKFLKSQTAVYKISRIIDDLKKAVNEARKREAYTD